MPFAYYGAKHGLARKYPRPRYPLIIEPFAGAAGYSCCHHGGRDVWLADADASVVDVWHRLQTTTAEDLHHMDVRRGEMTKDLLVLGIGGPLHWERVVRLGNPHAVTPRMADQWPINRDRICRTLPALRTWEIWHGDYRETPDVEATWFIDPPYQPIRSGAGEHYQAGSDGIDYHELAEWCQSRRGQVIVCEQSPAAWLPFTPIARNQGGDTRTEVVWLSDQQQLSMF